MKQVKQKVVDKGKAVSPAHVIKLLDKIGLECHSSFFDLNSRKVIRARLEALPQLLDKMDEQDDVYQELPEVRIPALKEELKRNDEILKNNHENFREQMQIGLYKEGYPQSASMYDSFMEKMELDLEEDQLKLKSGLIVLSPTFEFQNNPRWIAIQKILYERNIKTLQDNLQDLQKMIDKVKKIIAEQGKRIKLRRLQIIDILKELKVDVTEFTEKTPDYIG